MYQPYGVVDGWPHGYEGRVPADTFNIDLATPAYYEWPVNKLVGDLYKSGTIPLWNPFQAGGTPLAAQYSSRVFFPYQIMEDISPVWSWDFFLLGRVLLAGFFTYLFLELAGLKTASAFMGGIAYMFSGSFTWFINLEQFVNPAMMLPAHLYCLEALARSGGKRWLAVSALSFGLVLLAGQPETALFVLFLGGCYYILRIIMLGKAKEAARRGAQYLFMTLLGLGLAAPQILPFVELMENSRHLHKPEDSVGTRDALKTFEAMRLIAPTISETPQSDNRSAVKSSTPSGEDFYYRIFPDNGAWDRLGGYMGTGGVLLALSGLAAAFIRRSRWSVFLLFFCGFGASIILKNFGIRPFLWLGALPVFDLVWTQRWAGPVWTFCLAVSAALGLEVISEQTDAKARTRALYALAGVFAVSLVAYVLLDFSYITKYIAAAEEFRPGGSFLEKARITWLLKPYFGPSVVMGSIVAGLFLVSAFAVASVCLRRGKGAYAFIPLIVLELWWGIPRGYDPSSLYLKLIPLSFGLAAAFFFLLERRKAAAVLAIAFAISFVAMDFSAVKGFPDRHDPFTQAPYARFLEKEAEQDRVMGGYGMLFPNYSSALKLQDVRFINSLAVASSFDYKNRFLQEEDFPNRSLWFTGRRTDIKSGFREAKIEDDIVKNLKYYSFLGVRYLIFPPDFELYGDTGSEPPLRSVYSAEDATIYENLDAFPRAYVAYKTRSVPSYREAHDMMSADDFDFGAYALVEEEEAALPDEGISGDGKAEITGFEPNSVIVRAATTRKGLLVLTDAYYPGWRAYIDGGRAKIFRVNGLVRGVILPEGEHEVVFKYQPWSFRLGAFVFAVSLAITGVCLARRTRSGNGVQ